MTAPVRIGVVTTSDRASAGVYVDEGTPEVVAKNKKSYTAAFLKKELS